MSIAVYLYTGIAIEAIALVLLIVLAARTQMERRSARNLDLKMQEISARYRKNRGWVYLLQMLGIVIMLLGTVLGE